MLTTLAQSDGAVGIATLVTAIAAAVTAIAAAVYTGFTILVARETTKLRQAQTEAVLVAHIEQDPPESSRFLLIVQNTGLRAAFDVRVETTPKELLVASGMPKSLVDYVEQIGIGTIAPSDKRAVELGRGTELKAAVLDGRLSTKLYWKSQGAKSASRACWPLSVVHHRVILHSDEIAMLAPIALRTRNQP